jgi:LuxR family maltose regulon positive regulatory protein
LASSDFNTASRLIEKGSLEALEHGELRLILNWVEQIPDTDIRNRPWLFIYHCWALLLSMQVEVVSPRIENTDWLLDSVSDDEAKNQEMQGYIAGLKAVVSAWYQDYTNGLDFANQALEHLSKNSWIRGYCAIVKAGAAWGSGDLFAAKDAYTECSSAGKVSGNKMLEVLGAVNLAHSIELEGHLHQSVKILQGTFPLAEQDGRVLPIAGYIHVELARLLYEFNELDLASKHLSEGIELYQQLGDRGSERIGHSLLARVHLAKGDFANVVTSIQKSEQAETSPETLFDMRGGDYPHIRLWLKEKKLEDLESWIKESGVNLDKVTYFKIKLTYTMHARVMIALGRENHNVAYYKDALDLLEELLELAESNGWKRKVIEILSLLTLAFQGMGDTTQAMTSLERALTIAEPEGYIRTFVDEGLPMEALLKRMKMKDRQMKEYVHMLLDVFADRKTLPSSLGPQPLIEPLSDREIEILLLIAKGLSNREIGSRLYLSLHTVKTHARNIYGKLGVHNRTQAAARARELEILPSS